MRQEYEKKEERVDGCSFEISLFGFPTNSHNEKLSLLGMRENRTNSPIEMESNDESDVVGDKSEAKVDCG